MSTRAEAASRLSQPLIGPFTVRHVLVLIATLAGVGLLLALLTAPISVPAPSVLPNPGSGFVQLRPETVGLAVGNVAPELSGTSDGQAVQLTDLAGNPIRLSDLRGRPVWINFWASWCPPCQEETPVLRSVYQTHRAEGLAIVAISVQETSAQDVERYAQTYGLEYTIGFDATSAIFTTYQAYGLPTQLFLDREGVIRAIVRGPLTEVEAERILAPLLAVPLPSPN